MRAVKHPGKLILQQFPVPERTQSLHPLPRSIRLDRLSPFFSHFSLSAQIFLAGTLCGTSSDHITEKAGHLHVLRRGRLTIFEPGVPPVNIEAPSVLLYPRPAQHTFRSDGADIVCAFVEFGAGMLNPLASALPKFLIVPLAPRPHLFQQRSACLRRRLTGKMAGRWPLNGWRSTSSSCFFASLSTPT